MYIIGTLILKFVYQAENYCGCGCGVDKRTMGMEIDAANMKL